MKKRRLLTGFFSLLLTILVVNTTKAQQIDIDPYTRYQEWIGIGATCKGGYQTFDWDYFINDIGISVHRKHLESIKVDQQLQMALDAQAVADASGQKLYHIGTPWSPEPDYKVGPYINCGWLSDDRWCGGSIDNNKYQQHADYLNAQIQKYKDAGLSLYGIGLQNEPWLEINYASCTYNWSQWEPMMEYVVPEINAAHPDVKIMAVEMAFAIGGDHNLFAKFISEDPQCKQLVDAFAYHGKFPGSRWKNTSGTDQYDPRPNGAMSQAYKERYNYCAPNMASFTPHWQTEFNFKNTNPNWISSDDNSCFAESACMLCFVRDMHGQIWTCYDWQLELLDKPNRLDMYKHWGHFIEPNSIVIGSGYDANADVTSVAFHHEANKTLTVVLMKMGSGNATTKLVDDNITSAGQWYMSDENNRWVDKGTVASNQSITLTGHSISTIHFTNYDPDLSPPNVVNYPLDNNVPITGLALNKNTSTLGITATEQLTITYSPSNTTEKDVTWTSSNESVVTVDANGLVTGISDGTATVTATAVADNSISDACAYTVTYVNQAPTIAPVSNMNLLSNAGLQTVNLTGIDDGDGNKTQTVSINATSDNTGLIPNPTVSFTSGNSTGTLSFTPVTDATGSATITVTVSDDGGTADGGIDQTVITFDVNVTAAYQDLPGRIEAEDTSYVSGDVQTAASGDTDGTDYVGWFGEGEELFYQVNVASAGTYDVSIRVASGQSGAALQLRSDGISIGDVSVPNTGGWVTWQTITTTVTLSAGSQTISIYQNAASSFNINWIEFTLQGGTPVTGVSLSGCPSGDSHVGESFTLSETITPSDATIKTVTWTSSNSSVATVTGGNVSIVGLGTATITVTTTDGGYTASCDLNVVKTDVTNVSLDQSSITLNEGETSQLTATVTPSDATNKSVSWSTSNASVATVVDGLVTAVGIGSATITATSDDNGSISATCAVTVDPVNVTSVSIVNCPTADVLEGVTVDLDADVLPANATDKSVSWSSSDESKATVDANGVVTALVAGSVNITVTTTDGSLTDVCSITITDISVPPTSVSITNCPATDINIGATVDLQEEVLPSNATNKNVSWSTSSASIATVGSSGLLTAVAEGTATITVTTEEGSLENTCAITVSPILPTSVSITNCPVGDQAIGATIDLNEEVLPANATDKSVSWASSDNAVATVDVNGVVNTVSEGTATITVSANSGSETATCAITVLPGTVNPTSVAITNCPSADLEVGASVDLNETVSPSGATDKSVSWSSSNTSVATVDASGTVTGIAEGQAIITVSTNTASLTDICVVQVVPDEVPVAGVNLGGATMDTLVVGSTEQLTATITPSNATDQSLVWSSNNSSVATVDQNGMVTAIGAGSATITVVTTDGAYTDQVEVIVSDDPNSIISLEENIMIYPNPVRDVLAIRASTIEIAKVKVFDILGNVVIDEEMQVYNLDLSGLSGGIYIVHVISNDNRQLIKKITKE